MNPVSDAAIEAMDRGWSVFPVNGKVPATGNGLLDASRDYAKVTSWFDRAPGNGVALATGATSGVWVVDLDGPEASAKLAELQERYSVLPKTVTAKTARGYHVYFRMPPTGDVRNSAGKIGNGIDVRGTGGYVVLPPSPHPEGAGYAWVAGRSPKDIQPAQPPPWLLQLVQDPPTRIGLAKAPPLPETIPQGQRDSTMASIAGSLRHRGASRDAILAAIRVENQTRCVPPLPESDLERIADSVSRYHPGTPSANGHAAAEEPGPRKKPEAPHLEIINREVLDRIRTEKLAPLSVVPTPWPSWNIACRGAGGGEGLAHGWHVIVGASSGAGKSLCATNIAASAVRAGEHVCLISLEMSQQEVVTRLLSIYAAEQVRHLEHGKQFSADVWDQAGDILAEAPGSIRVNPDPITTLDQIAGVIEHYAGLGCRTFIVDYLQLAWVKHAETMVHQITEVSHTIRGLAKQHNVLSIGLSQLNRATSGAGGELRKEGLLGGSSLENDAEQVVLLSKPTPSGDTLYRSEAKLDKNRHGPPVDWGLLLDTRTLRLRELDPDEEAHRAG